MKMTIDSSDASILSNMRRTSVDSQSQEPIYSAIVSPDRITEKPTIMLRPSTVHMGSAAPLEPPYGINPPPPPTNASEMVSAPRASKISKKPKRPFTAYQIYFQIEREFIIQTMTDEDADKSVHEGKIFFRDVPDRYKAIKLSPDWYFGPGKRAKRKHHKQHGKIGFHELSRVISSRWATLEVTHPDIKHYVTKLANQEYDEYKYEMKVYRENLTKKMIAPTVILKSSDSTTQQPAPQRMHQQEAAGVMALHQMMASQHTQPHPSVSSFSFHVANQPNEDRSFVNSPAPSNQEVNQLENAYAQKKRGFNWGPQPKDDFDSCISRIDKDEPKVEGSFVLNFVDIGDDDIISMWEAIHSE
jgi:hypothetical protein